MLRKKANLEYQRDIGGPVTSIKVEVGDNLEFNFGAMFPTERGVVVDFKYSKFYHRYEAVVVLESGSTHYTSRITGYGIGAYKAS